MFTEGKQKVQGYKALGGHCGRAEARCRKAGCPPVLWEDSS